MIRPDIEAIEKCRADANELCCDNCEPILVDRLWDSLDALLAYTQEREAENKRIQFDTAMKCAYLAWQACLHQTEPPERVICRNYGINLDSLYSTTWKELNK